MTNKALIIATYGNRALIKYNNKKYNCYSRSHVKNLIIGDMVEFINDKQNIIITKILARKNLLQANNKNIVANVDELNLVLALKPYPQLASIDNYLIKAISSNIKINIIVNKIDLIKSNKVKELMQIYKNINYNIIYISIKNLININQLKSKLANKTSIFIGQSGVGKTSIINLLTKQNNKISPLTKTGLGKHTTTNSCLYEVENNGKIIDSPGVREFIPHCLTIDEIKNGFIEFNTYSHKCKFHNCQHINEPQCEIKQQVKLKNISKYRYNNYVNLLTNK